MFIQSLFNILSQLFSYVQFSPNSILRNISSINYPMSLLNSFSNSLFLQILSFSNSFSNYSFILKFIFKLFFHSQIHFQIILSFSNFFSNYSLSSIRSFALYYSGTERRRGYCSAPIPAALSAWPSMLQNSSHHWMRTAGCLTWGT